MATKLWGRADYSTALQKLYMHLPIVRTTLASYHTSWQTYSLLHTIGVGIPVLYWMHYSVFKVPPDWPRAGLGPVQLSIHPPYNTHYISFTEERMNILLTFYEYSVNNEYLCNLHRTTMQNLCIFTDLYSKLYRASTL